MRLTITSGLSLGQCLRTKYRHTPKIYNSAIICWVVATCVILGNTLYECNNWAGGGLNILSQELISCLTSGEVCKIFNLGRRYRCCYVHAGSLGV